MTYYIKGIIEDAVNGGCDYCDFITLVLDAMSCCDSCPYDVENSEQCALTDMGDWIK